MDEAEDVCQKDRNLQETSLGTKVMVVPFFLPSPSLDGQTLDGACSNTLFIYLASSMCLASVLPRGPVPPNPPALVGTPAKQFLPRGVGEIVPHTSMCSIPASQASYCLHGEQTLPPSAVATTNWKQPGYLPASPWQPQPGLSTGQYTAHCACGK